MTNLPNYEKNPITTPVKAIRAKCLDCSGNDRNEVKGCSVTSCPLWPFRNSAKNPFHKRTTTISDDMKEKFSERMKKAWETRRANQKKANEND